MAKLDQHQKLNQGNAWQDEKALEMFEQKKSRDRVIIESWYLIRSVLFQHRNSSWWR